MDFLLHLHDKGLSYSAINTARSALSSVMKVEGVPFGNSELVTRFMRGIFNINPALPKHARIWDTNIVLHYLEKMSPRKSITLKQLTLKTVMLLALLTGQRAQTIYLFEIDNITFQGDQVQITIARLIKTSKPSWHLEPIKFTKYVNKKLCIVTYLKHYMDRTRVLRNNEQQLFISYRKPYKKVTKSTISRWVRTVMAKSGIDTSKFKAHSTRAATNSKVSKFLPLTTILKSGGWRNSVTYAKHYNLQLEDENTVAKVILDKFH